MSDTPRDERRPIIFSHNRARTQAWQDAAAASSRAIKKRAAARAAALNTAGVLQTDGTVFLAELKDGTKIYAMPADAGLSLDFNAAAAYVDRTNSAQPHGHDDWRLPTRAELELLARHQDSGAFKDTFNTDDQIEEETEGDYWSGTEVPSNDSVIKFNERPIMYVVRMSDGVVGRNDVCCAAAVRLVRAVPPSA